VPTRRTLPVDSRVIRIGVVLMGVAFLAGAAIMAFTGHPRLFLVRGDPMQPPWSWLAALVMLGIGVGLLAIGTRRGEGGLLHSPAFAGMVLFSAGGLVATAGAQAFSGSLESDAAGVQMTGAGVYVAGAILLIIGVGLLVLAGITLLRAVEGPDES
jgi:hypothetical protein